MCKTTEYDSNVWKRFFRNVSENREIAGEMNILICRFMMDIKKKDGVAYEPTTKASFASCLHSQEKKKKNSIYRRRSVNIGKIYALGLETSVPKTSGTVSSNTDLPAGE